jgi:hypothetical protein
MWMPFLLLNFRTEIGSDGNGYNWKGKATLCGILKRKFGALDQAYAHIHRPRSHERGYVRYPQT